MSGDEDVLIEDQQYRQCLGSDLWTLKEDEFFTNMHLVGSDGSVSGHLCVLASASPVIKDEALNSATYTYGVVPVSLIKYNSTILKHFVQYAYRGSTSVAPENLTELYNLADYLMVGSLQAAITRTVGSIPANIPNIAEVLRSRGKDLGEKDDEGGQEQVMPLIKEELVDTTSAGGDDPPADGDKDPEVSAAVPETGSTVAGTGTVRKVNRRKRRNIKTTPKRRKPPPRQVQPKEEHHGGDDDDDNDDDNNDAGGLDDDFALPDDDTNDTDFTPRRRTLRSRRSAGASAPSMVSAPEPPRPVGPEFCDECGRLMCTHRQTVITAEEMKLHIKEEEGIVIDAPTVNRLGASRAVKLALAGQLMTNGELNEEFREKTTGDDPETLVKNAARDALQAVSSMGLADEPLDTSGTSRGGGSLNASANTSGVEAAGEKGSSDKGPEEEGTPNKEGGESDKGETSSPDKASAADTPVVLKNQYQLWVDRETGKTRKLYPCMHCGDIFPMLGKLLQHLPKHTGRYGFSCPLCPRSYRTRPELAKHDKRTHNRMAMHGVPGGRHVCPICSIAYAEAKQLAKHKRNHDYDTRVVKANYKLKRKANSNRLSKVYPCTICGMEFNKGAEHEAHMSTHTGIKLYECNICGKSFGMESYLKKHQLRHASEKKYICALCGSSFKTSSGLYTHEHTVHIDDKPFVCEICHKEFKMKWSMKEHMRMAHASFVLPPGQTSEWQCSKCGEFLPSETMFKIHEKGHVTDKLFQCRICPEAFKYRAARLNHERREHHRTGLDSRLVEPAVPSVKVPKVKKPRPEPQPQQHKQQHDFSDESRKYKADYSGYNPHLPPVAGTKSAMQHLPVSSLPPSSSSDRVGLAASHKFDSSAYFSPSMMRSVGQQMTPTQLQLAIDTAMSSMRGAGDSALNSIRDMSAMTTHSPVTPSSTPLPMGLAHSGATAHQSNHGANTHSSHSNHSNHGASSHSPAPPPPQLPPAPGSHHGHGGAHQMQPPVVPAPHPAFENYYHHLQPPPAHHATDAHVQMSATCSICNMQFDSQNMLWHHMTLHNVGMGHMGHM